MQTLFVLNIQCVLLSRCHRTPSRSGFSPFTTWATNIILRCPVWYCVPIPTELEEPFTLFYFILFYFILFYFILAFPRKIFFFIFILFLYITSQLQFLCSLFPRISPYLPFSPDPTPLHPFLFTSKEQTFQGHQPTMA